VVQEDIKFLETAQKEPRLGGEEEKRKEMLRRRQYCETGYAIRADA